MYVISNRPLLRMPTFWVVMTLSGFLGLAISFTSMWFLHQTGATTYRQVYSFFLILKVSCGTLHDCKSTELLITLLRLLYHCLQWKIVLFTILEMKNNSLEIKINTEKVASSLNSVLAIYINTCFCFSIINRQFEWVCERLFFLLMNQSILIVYYLSTVQMDKKR